MPNYKLTVQYDGTDYYGWQSQPQGNTIQDELTAAIEKVLRQKINLVGSGRTDSGVHALGQVANFKSDLELDKHKFHHSINSILKKSIAVKKIEEVGENFHARFDAKKRSYFYLLRKNKNPFYDRYSFRFAKITNVSINSLNELSSMLVGDFDFTSFCKTNSETENRICSIYNCYWRESRDFFLFKIEANRFLHGMVRAIVGTLLFASVNNKSVSYLNEILKSKNRESAGEAAPAKGLFLYKVKY